MKNTLVTGMMALSLLTGSQANAVETTASAENSEFNIELLEIAADGTVNINQKQVKKVDINEDNSVLAEIRAGFAIKCSA